MDPSTFKDKLFYRLVLKFIFWGYLQVDWIQKPQEHLEKQDPVALAFCIHTIELAPNKTTC